ncbi:DUF3459 domain-containing protein [bacterium]|nr:DUF3459 domain-containing protein [bacterium]
MILRNSIFRATLFAMAISIFSFGCAKQAPPPATAVTDAEDWFMGQPLYEVYLRAYSDDGTLTALTADLDRLQNLGVKTLWLMPIFPVGVEGRKGTAGSPYSVQDYYEIGDEYGTLDDLKTLVKEAHDHDMAVILDVVMNHSANDHHLMSEHPDWYMKDEDGNFTREVADWSDITDWDHSSEGARNYLIGSLIHWIEEADIDGYRCDVAGMVPADFWEQAIPQLRQRKPNVFLLAEWEDPWILDTGFNAGYDWNLYHRMKEHAHGGISTDSLWSAVEQKHTLYPPGKQAMRFIENHDEPRAAEAFGWPNLRPYGALIYTLPGIPLLYTGQEIGETHKPSLFEDEPVNWQAGDPEIGSFYRDLLALRTQYTALREGSTVRLPYDGDNVLLFQRIHDDERMLVAINFGDQDATVERPPSLGAGDFVDVTDSSPLEAEFTVPGYGYRVFQLQ